jgi:hypothetical protein
VLVASLRKTVSRFLSVPMRTGPRRRSFSSLEVKKTECFKNAKIMPVRYSGNKKS